MKTKILLLLSLSLALFFVATPAQAQDSSGPERSGSMITFTRARGQGPKSLRVFDPGNI